MKDLSETSHDNAGSGQALPSAIKLPSPCQLRADLPLNDTAKRCIDLSRQRIRRLLDGRDRKRLLVVCGPCGISDPRAAMAYALRLHRLARELQDSLLIVMRAYFEKPRTTTGWKGFAYDPLLNGELDPARGIQDARKLLGEINSFGLPCATEFLSPTLSAYFSDAIAYGCIGSRTAESQTHRELASSMPMPMGMKNGMDGSADTALNAVIAARAAHVVFGANDEGQPIARMTKGNPHAHIVLRGGHSGPNFQASHIEDILQRGSDILPLRPILVDCSHGNSGKDPRQQPKVAQAVVSQFLSGQARLAGIMLESHLVEGNQPFRPGQPHGYGQSITDGCLGWEETEGLLRSVAKRLS